MTDTTPSFQSSWTLAEALIFDISNFQRAGRAAWLTGNLEKYYWEFEAIVRVLWGIIDEDERLEARAKEKEILSTFPVTRENKNKVAALLKDYDGLVMIFLHKHKLDVPPKRDRTVMIA
jgi:hypothetical protein